MLLDRRGIRKWAKWVALILAIIFAISFVAMGVGQGTGGMNVLDAFSCSGDQTPEPQTEQERLNALLQTLEANPKDTTTMLAVATMYESMYAAGEGNGTEYLVTAAAFLRNAIDVDPSLKDVYLRVAKIYMEDELQQFDAAVPVLNQATTVDPTNADVFLNLGIAQNSLGNKTGAVLAWQKYLELEPNGEMASVVRQQIEKLTATTTTTAATNTTSTTAGSTTTSGQ